MGRILALIAVWAFLAISGHAQDYTFTTIAGVPGSRGGDNGTGSALGKPLFNNPTGIVRDTSGNVFVMDTRNHTIRKIDTNGVVTTFAGSSGVADRVDGTGANARFSSPQGAAIDSANNIYVADYGSHTIRKITPAGVVTTLAGSGSAGSLDGTGAAAYFNHPISVALDATGNLFVADSDNHQIRKIVISTGVVSLWAGSPILVSGGLDSTGDAGNTALFFRPHGVAVDSAGVVYVADTGNNTIRKIATTSKVTTLAGTANTYGNVDGTGPAARFDFPNSLTVDSSGNLYVADEANHTIRKVTAAGVVTTIAGSAGNPGFVDAIGTAAKFNHPTAISVDASGDLYISDYTNNLIRKVTASTGQVTTLAGVAGTAGSADGTGYSLTTASTFDGPSGTAVDAGGNIYVADTNTQLIRKIVMNSAGDSGTVTTLAGRLYVFGSIDATWTAATFNYPSGLAVQKVGTDVIVADTSNHLIRKITSTGGVVTTLAGKAGISGKEFATKQIVDPADSTKTITVPDPAAPLFNLPSSVAADSAGNIYVADYNNHNIRKISPAGVTTIFAGTGAAGSANGDGTQASFNRPRGLAIDGTYLYVADSGNSVIRKITLAGPATVTTVAGSAGQTGSSDGAGLTAAKFNSPTGVAVDGAGVVFVADTGNQTIRAISTAGVVTTLAGKVGSAGYADGTGSAVRFDQPMGISVYNGILYVADYRNNLIRKGVVATVPPGSGPGPITGTTPTGNGQLLLPKGMISIGNLLYVADTSNNSIKQYTIGGDGTTTVFVGKDGTVGSSDGTGAAALFRAPTGLATDRTFIYVADTGNALIRKITSAGVVTTIAGSATNRGNKDGNGANANFQSPTGIAVESSGDIYVADSETNTIRKITGAGDVTTVAGSPMVAGDADGAGGAARFNRPTGLISDGLGNLYVADSNNNTIRRMNIAEITTTTPATPAFTVTTVAGAPGISGSYDGLGNFALFSRPTGLAYASAGNIYIADTGNNLIRVLQVTGIVYAIGGMDGISGYRDGASLTALFDHPEALTVTSANEVYVADTGNSSIRYFSGTTVKGLSLKAPTTPTTPTTPSTPSTPSSGGGGMEIWFVVGFLSLTLFARKARHQIL